MEQANILKLPARNAISWDDGTIADQAKRMGADMAEPFTWLKRHVRDDCDRDFTKFIAECRELGITTDLTNWVRILKGQWRWDQQGNELPAPCLSAENLLNNIRSLREKVRVEFFQGKLPFFKTTVFNTINRYVSKLRRPDWVNKWGMIVGPTGSQKSASYKELHLADPDIGHMEASDAGFGQFISDLGELYGENATCSQMRKKRTIFKSVTSKNCIIIDNFQELLQIDRTGQQLEAQQKTLSFLRTLQDKSGCAIIVNVNREKQKLMFKDQLGYMEQFIGRIGGQENILQIPDYPPRKDVLIIAKGMGMIDAADHNDELFMLGQIPGRIRSFFGWIQEGKLDAEAEDESFTWNHVATRLETAGIVLKKKAE